jgi:hypothetical protein
VRGAELAAAFHREVVGPILVGSGIGYAAGRLGTGSDVLGLDDERSRDHDWGCRLTVLVDEADRAAIPAVIQRLDRELPDQFQGHPVRFGTTRRPAVSHQVEVATVRDYSIDRLGSCPGPDMSIVDWLTLTGQGVLELVAGPVFVDSTVELGPVRARLAGYPSEVERYLLACGWQRITQRMPLVGRTADTGQALQSRLLGATLVDDLIGLAFLLHRQWEPYDKWREVLFQRLPTAAGLTPHLSAAVTADDWRQREDALAAAAELLAQVQRDRGLPTPAEAVVPFHDRPYRTVTDGLAGGLRHDLTDPALRALPLVGNLRQWVDSVDVLADATNRVVAATAYRTWIGRALQSLP